MLIMKQVLWGLTSRQQLATLIQGCVSTKTFSFQTLLAVRKANINQSHDVSLEPTSQTI